MKVVVFGGSGRTGRELIVQALARGHDVTAVIRRPDAFSLRYDRLRVVAGDALRPATFGEALDGQDAVLSTLGVTGIMNSLRPMAFYRDSARAIIERMRAADVRRLAVVSSVGVLDHPSTPFWHRALVKPLLGRKYADMRAMEELVAQSGLDWTIVRAARLVAGPLTQRYRVGPDGSLPDIGKISTGDLADLVARQADDMTMSGRSVAVSY